MRLIALGCGETLVDEMADIPVWMFKAGPESCEGLPKARAGVYTWTAPKSAKRGDLFYLYCTRPSSSFVALGRLCTDPVPPRRSRLRRGRGTTRTGKPRYAAWVQIIGFEHPTHLHEARMHGDLRGWGALRNLAGTHARVPDAGVRWALEEILLLTNPAASDRHRKWLTGSPYPRDLDPREPARLMWEPPPPGKRPNDHEVFLQRRIAKYLRHHGWRDHDRERDGFSIPPSNLLRLDERSRGFPDIVMVSTSRQKVLVVVEVKKDATPYPGRNGVDQLDDYGPAMRRVARGWTVERWLVARSIHPVVQKWAADRRIETYEWQGQPARLKKV